eukprot:g1378.t1
MNNATIVIFDCGSGSEIEIDSGITRLDAAKRGIRELLQYHIMNRKKDEIAIVLCGAEDAQDDAYENIQVLGDVGLDVAHPQIIDALERVQSTKKRANILDAIDLAASMFGDRKKVGKKFRHRVVVVSCDEGKTPCTYTRAGIEALLAVCSKDMYIRIDGVGIGDQFTNIKAIERATSNLLRELSLNESIETALKAESSAGKTVAVAAEVAEASVVGNAEEKSVAVAPLIAVLAKLTKGTSQAARTAADVVAGCASKVNGTTTVFRGDMRIGSDVSIAVHAFNRTTPISLPTLKKESAHAASDDRETDLKNPRFGKVTMDREHRSSVTQEEVPPEKRRNGYRYGADIVVLDDSDKHALAFHSEKCLEVIGFVDGSSVPRHHSLSKTVVLCPAPNNPRAAHKMSALRDALTETGYKAIVRFVKRKNTQPFLGCVEPGAKFLVFNQLPFVEDLRDYSFGVLMEDDRFRSSDAQLKAVDALIDAMPMSTSTLPENCLNPVISRFYRCLHQRSRDAQSKVERKPDSVEAAPIEPSSTMLSTSAAIGALSSLRHEFVVKRRPQDDLSKKRKRTSFWGDRDGCRTENKSSNTKVANNGRDIDNMRLAGDSLVVDRTSSSSGAILRDLDLFGSGKATTDCAPPTKVGQVDPVGDFESMVTHALSQNDVVLLSRARDEMFAQALALAESGSSLFVQKATLCIRSLRKAAVRSSIDPNAFNAYLSQIKSSSATDSARTGLWNILVSESVSLVTSAENANASSSAEDAAAFLKSPSDATSPGASKAPDEDADDEDPEDLFASMA